MWGEVRIRKHQFGICFRRHPFGMTARLAGHHLRHRIASRGNLDTNEADEACQAINRKGQLDKAPETRGEAH